MNNRALFINKQTFFAVLSGAYTPFDLREFVQLCHDLALPIIRKKIALGKLNLHAMGLKEIDVVYDCVADLFVRDEHGAFIQIRMFFEKQLGDISTSSEEQLIVTLRRLIFGKINNNIVRLYSESDPALGKILRNLKLGLERSGLFEEITRFGDLYLVPRGIDHLLHLPPIQFDFVQHEFSRTVLVHDTVPEMLKKLHAVLGGQEEFQRAISLISTAILFKEVYQLGWEAGQVTDIVEEKIESDHLTRLIEDICHELQTEMYHGYVQKGKCSKETFGKYIETVKKILHASFVNEHLDGGTFYSYLEAQIPGLTKEEYKRDHRTILEYFAKIGKERLRAQLKNK